ncbi:GTP pyrophosphokinase family protein [Kosakonia sacchari]|uniref:RelA/SpoT domain-containing protein n=1 Tax=Kosakonia sacchari TaxID=1158459 RepID=A0ABZ0MKQ3_9ENTR|nr:RelA/SpoT domain-containing protein [Kosakonia sacchari]WOZ75693.1 RelA/SpoT domain-containing protein [Kosakonia sacchari]
MDINEFREFLETHQKAYAAWGQFVSEEINRTLRNSIGDDKAAIFLKLHSDPRLKTIASALGKVSRKGYDNPIVQMTDLVGVRFVVLLSVEIETISDIIETCDKWYATVSKDYLSEIDVNPKIFDYQSRHYEVRPKARFDYCGESITPEMCCEVQVRTLLQHAYAELVHDSIYKPSSEVPKSAERQIARSMALMETTDDLFCKTMEILADNSKKRNKLLEFLSEYYADKIGKEYIDEDINVNFSVIDTFKDHIDDNLPNKIHTFLCMKKYITAKIINRVDSNPLFSQPCILFVYWLAHQIDSGEILSKWPLPGNISGLELVLSDLGNSISR